MHKVNGKDNSLLVEFDFVIDLDLGLYKLFKERFINSDLVNKEILSLDSDPEIILLLLARDCINPLDLFFYDKSISKQTLDNILNDDDLYKDLLYNYCLAYDTFALMITYLKEASSVAIDILCKNEIEENYIKELNSSVHTIIYPEKKKINLNNYTAIYMKYYTHFDEYSNIRFKHIYIPYAKYSLERKFNVANIEFIKKCGDINLVHLIDLYKYIKYKDLLKLTLQEEQQNGQDKV